jgi:ATP-dependent helicase/nuclease subunit B
MPTLCFLKSKTSLAGQVAGFLLRSGGYDLSDSEVWIPTAGAARRIRRALAETGVLSPRFLQPMQALLPEGAHLASRIEREGAWAQVLASSPPDFLEPLFPDSKVLSSEAARLKSAGVLCDLCDLLAEGGLNPASPDVHKVCEGDSERWQVLAKLHWQTLRFFRRVGLLDPNEARLAEIEKSSRNQSLRRLVIACIPDLSLAAQRYAEALERAGVRVEVLVWLPAEAQGGFDGWGRPDPLQWAACQLPVEESQISISRSPAEEARAALDFASRADSPGDYALVLADPSLSSAFRAEIDGRGGKAFLPEGANLESTEPAILLLEWLRFKESLDLRVLRRLCELPAFGRLLARFGQCEALAVCDHLIAVALLSDFDQARLYAQSPIDPAREKTGPRIFVREFVENVESLLLLSPRDLIPRAWRGGGEGMVLARRLSKLHAGIEASPVFQNWSEGGLAVLARALRSESDFTVSEPGDVELSGWLEAPWIEAERMGVYGCIEGLLPTRVDGHAFLPDSARQALGLANNAGRLARDAYLFQALMASRDPTDLQFSFSRFDQEGSPSLPSSLLLRCPQEDLPARVLKTFGEIPAPSLPPTRVNQWRWSLPAELRRSVVKLSPTDFREYLACPFRFYLKKVLRLENFDPNAREMDSLSFGSILHSALELFGKENPLESDAAKIERQILANLDDVVREQFGAKPSPAVRIQVEAAKVRLRAFAHVQAAEFAKGWRIVSVERKLESDERLCIGPLPLSGKIDRIERHEQTGSWRVMDYKTYAQSKIPAKSHFGPPSAVDWLPGAQLQIGGKSKSWIDLQLPLYLRIFSHWHGLELGDTSPSTAYFILSSDPAETSVQEFVELDSAVQNSAMSCAEEIASRVAQGVFWPPRTASSRWEDSFEALFTNGKPEDCIDPDTIRFLEGGQ